jgi:hypothetical protein
MGPSGEMGGQRGGILDRAWSAGGQGAESETKGFWAWCRKVTQLELQPTKFSPPYCNCGKITRIKKFKDRVRGENFVGGATSRDKNKFNGCSNLVCD